jgi:hypothetical protein
MAQIKKRAAGGTGKSASVGRSNIRYKKEMDKIESGETKVPKNFFQSEAKAIDRQYVYFGYFEDKFNSMKDSKTGEVSSLGKQTMDKWKAILVKAIKEQEGKEKNLKNAILKVKTEMKDANSEYSAIVTPYDSTDPIADLKYYVEGVNFLFLNNELSRRINDTLPAIINDIVLQHIQETKEQIINAGINRDPAALENFTDEFYRGIFNKINKHIESLGIKDYKMIPSLEPETLKTLKVMGKIKDSTPARRNKMTRMLLDNADIDISNFDRIIKGVAGEFSAIISSIGDDMSPNIRSTGTDLGANKKQIKADIKVKFNAKAFKNIIIPASNISYSVKSSVPMDLKDREGVFRRKSTIAGGADLSQAVSLENRYEQIRTMLAYSKLDFDNLFYNINNEVIRSKGKIVSMEVITRALAYTALGWMFDKESIKDIEGPDNQLLFFIVGGRIIPASVILELMLNKVASGVNPEQIVKASIKPIQTNNVLNYWDEWKKKDAAGPRTRDTELGGASRPWRFMRDWVQRTSEMRIYLETDKLFKTLGFDANPYK